MQKITKMKMAVRIVLDCVSPIFVVVWFCTLGIRPNKSESLILFGRHVTNDEIMPLLLWTIPLVIFFTVRSLFVLNRLSPYTFVSINRFAEKHPFAFHFLSLFIPIAIFAIFNIFFTK